MKLLIASFIALVLMLGSVVAQDQVTVDSRTFGAITARHIGPAVMSGRVAAIAASNADPRIIYIGAATGGVWKSTNGGVSFKPVFDKYTQAIGFRRHRHVQDDGRRRKLEMHGAAEFGTHKQNPDRSC
jgi:hypothetical protein